MLQTADKLVRMKKLRWWQLIVSIPVAFALFWWLFMEFEDALRGPVTIGGIIGGIIGLAIGIGILVKMQRTNDALIRQIREIKNIKE